MSENERDRLAERIATLRAAVAWMDKMAPDHMNDAMEIIDAQAAEIERLRASVIEECLAAIDAKIADHAEAFPGPGYAKARLMFAFDGRVFAAALRALKEREAGQ